MCTFSFRAPIITKRNVSSPKLKSMIKPLSRMTKKNLVGVLKNFEIGDKKYFSTLIITGSSSFTCEERILRKRKFWQTFGTVQLAWMTGGKRRIGSGWAQGGHYGTHQQYPEDCEATAGNYAKCGQGRHSTGTQILLYSKCCDKEGHIAIYGSELVIEQRGGLAMVKKAVWTYLFKEKFLSVLLIDPYSAINNLG
jgi:hypothetical protein